MKEHVARKIGFLKTTAIGGLVFLLPLIVIGILLGQLVPIVLTVAQFLNETLGFKSATGYAVLALTATLPLYYLRFVFADAGRADIFDFGIVWIEVMPVLLLFAWEERGRWKGKRGFHAA